MAVGPALLQSLPDARELAQVLVGVAIDDRDHLCLAQGGEVGHLAPAEAMRTGVADDEDAIVLTLGDTQREIALETI